MTRIFTEVKYSLKAFFRNRSTLFWTFIFPVMIMVFMVYVFGGSQGTVTVYYSDHDNSATSQAFISALNSTGSLQLTDSSDRDLNQMLLDGKIMMYIDIPRGFEQATKTQPTNQTSIHVYYDKCKPAALPVVSAVQQVADQYSMKATGTKPIMPVISEDITTNSVNYVQFLLPGVIGMTVMMTCVNGTVIACVKNRSRGIFRKLATTPITKIEWNASRILTQTITLLISLAVSLAVAYALFQVVPQINAVTVMLVIFGGVLFAGLGTLLTVFLKDEDAAVFGASALTFPLMFVSGSFTSLDTLPDFMKVISQVSPLTYLNNGLRSSMVTGNLSDAALNLAIVAVIAVMLFTAGVLLLKWKDD